MEPLPPLPLRGTDPYYDERDAWDDEVTSRLQGYLAIENIAAVVLVQTGAEARPESDGVVVWVDKDDLGAPNAAVQDLVFTTTSGGFSPSTTTVTFTTLELDPAEIQLGNLNLGPTYILKKIIAYGRCRVRLYDTDAHRDADILRPRGEDPDPEVDSGLILDYAFQAAAPRTLSPMTPGGGLNVDGSTSITIDNLAAAPAVVAVSFIYLRVEQ